MTPAESEPDTDPVDLDPADVWPFVPSFQTIPGVGQDAFFAHHGAVIVHPPPAIAKLGYGPVVMLPVGDPVVCTCGCKAVTIPVAIGGIA